MRWLKELQQYEFEIIRCKGQTHQNAEKLSRQSEKDGYDYWAEVQLQNVLNEERTGAQIVLEENNWEERWKDRLEDCYLQNRISEIE